MEINEFLLENGISVNFALWIIDAIQFYTIQSGAWSTKQAFDFCPNG